MIDENDDDKKAGPKMQSIESAAEAAIKNNVKHFPIIFDWCRWEWSFTGRRGIWDSDFRFETYSLGLVYLVDTKIDIFIEFDDDEKNGASSGMREYFKECLTLQEQLQVQLKKFE